MTAKMATREAYGKALVEIGAENPNLIVMDADLSKSTKTGDFLKVYPERFFNMGIAGQNLYGTAAGLALSGKVVCASTFAMFASGRAFPHPATGAGPGYWGRDGCTASAAAPDAAYTAPKPRRSPGQQSADF